MIDETQVESFIKQVERLCQKRNIRLTTQRKTVLFLMAKAQGAISAYDLLDQLKLTDTKAKPPTIYRALDFLMEHGFIHKIESANSYILCPHIDNPAHMSVLFICLHCRHVAEHPTTDMKKQLHSLAQEHNFDMQHAIVEIHGTCHTCLKPSSSC